MRGKRHTLTINPPPSQPYLLLRSPLGEAWTLREAEDPHNVPFSVHCKVGLDPRGTWESTDWRGVSSFVPRRQHGVWQNL